MSRLRRLKENRRKNIIKTTMASLALVLAIGSTQTIGTYALFTDTENVPSNLSISTGDVDVEVEEVSHITDIEPGDGKVITMPVRITNNGTLNQNIRLKLSTSSDIESYLKHKFVFNNGITTNNDGVMYNGEELFVLAPGESITGSTNITVDSMSKELQNSLAGKPQNVNLTIESTQVNKDNTLVNNGFCDVAIQENTISVAQSEIITIVNGGEAFFTNGGSNEYKKLYIPVNINVPDGYTFKLSAVVDSIDKHGNISKGEYSAQQENFGGKDYILIQPKGDTGELLFGGTFNITINVTVKKDNGKEETYQLKCNTTLANAGNNCSNPNHPDHNGAGNGGKCKNTIVYSNHVKILDIPEDLDASKEELEEPSEPELVEPPKTEVEVPTKPEVVEPPKEEVVAQSEPEVVEPPKEEAVVPSKPDIIVPSKEEIEIQE